MSEINCNIVKDLMPLYIDGIVSDETAGEIQEHIEQCNECQEEYKALTQNLTLPSNTNIQQENSRALKAFSRKLKSKKIMVSFISVIITVLVTFAGYMVYQNVGVVHDYLSPFKIVSLRDGKTDIWKQVYFEDQDYLEFDSIFYSRKVVNDANSAGIVEIRISDTVGNIVIDNFTVLPGETADLKQLDRNIKYIVQVKTTAEFIFLRFI